MSTVISDEPLVWLHISDVADVTLGKTPKKSEYRSIGRHRLFKYRDIQNNTLVLDQTKDGFVLDDPEILRSLRPVEIGDVLVGASGHSSESIGRKVAIVEALPPDGPHYFAGELLRVKPISEALDSRWIFYYLTSAQGFQTLQDAVSGVHLTNGRARQMKVPMAPSHVQRAISDVLDGASLASGSSSRHLSTARRAIERFRKSVLAAACSGRLTADWREESNESADDGLPKGWRLVSFGDVCQRITVGHVGKMVSEYRDSGVPFLRSLNVRELRFEPKDLKFISHDFHHKLRKSALQPGDIAVVRSGFVGTACVIPKDLALANCSDLVIARPGTELRSGYGAIYVNSAQMKAHVSDVKVGSAQSHFNTRSMQAAPLRLPPIDEQREIERRVDQLLGFADGLLARIDAASRRVERSSQAVLAKAFRGELVA